MKQFLSFKNFRTVALVVSLSLPVFAGQPRKNVVSYNEPPVVCNVNEDESYCFANATQNGETLKLVCAKVNNRCPSAADCLKDPTDADAQMQALGAYSGENPDSCAQFASRPPPRGGGMGGAAGPGR
jgi:hypothetical protein